ncbi:protein translocase subunit SecD [Candidatus Campbellbacteria bacterium CG22_combo_CG10-13_8_21_14_all_43_18]|uniref:Protein translocase subunit SecD n=1 Tax=Candidatus Campbellbacteria bacterium CG22_combo_CG10-13_8_21_14_all_43_18 TaxID=1974530 RepID=A0A2H0DWB1_9BACT|nr:MAG: protein translocase subunit SecD [Candidatus Campbellbacteria bacterium CG22_combo_CG10-13_8_21_14_all_43_18]
MKQIRIAGIFIILVGISLGYLALSKASFKLGLDLSGGTELIYKADTAEAQRGEIKELMASLREVIEKRVNLFGVGEPSVQVEEGGLVGDINDQRLIVGLPGISDVGEAIKLIGQTPLLEFRLFDEQSLVENTATEEVSPESLLSTGLSGRQVKRATLQFNSGAGHSGVGLSEPVVGLEFNDEGSLLFERITEDNIGRPLAILLDGTVISAPIINTKISGGSAVITGNFTPEEARTLVRDLNFGALPLPIELVSTESVGPSLGRETTEAGVKAGIYGVLLVFLFMALWYRVPGLLSVISLLIYIALMLLLFKLIPVTLTAAGIAGFILSIGMAVDANVLIFERVKEELQEGTPDMREAVKNGFSRAWLSIRDSNISSIITAIILFWFGTSVVKGFALTFGLGVLVSMLSAISISRILYLAVSPEKPNKFFGLGLKN